MSKDSWIEDPQWIALKEQVKEAAREKSLGSEGARAQAQRCKEFYQSPEQMGKMAQTREMLMTYYLSQDLNDGLERHPSEIAAIKASRPKSRRKAAR